MVIKRFHRALSLRWFKVVFLKLFIIIPAVVVVVTVS